MVTDSGFIRFPDCFFMFFLFSFDAFILLFSLIAYLTPVCRTTKFTFNFLILNSQSGFYPCSVAQSCPTLCNPMDWSTQGFPVFHHLPELSGTHVHWVYGVIQPSCPLLSPPPPTFNLSQHQGLFQWGSSLHQVPKVLELQLQHQSFRWVFRTDFL